MLLTGFSSNKYKYINERIAENKSIRLVGLSTIRVTNSRCNLHVDMSQEEPKQGSENKGKAEPRRSLLNPPKSVSGNGHSDGALSTSTADAETQSDEPQSSVSASETSEATSKPKPRRLLKSQKSEGGLVQLVREQAEELKELREQIDAVGAERDDIQDQYDDLLDKVTHIKSTLGERLKTDAAKLQTCQKELEAAKQDLSSSHKAQAAAEKVAADNKAKLEELEATHKTKLAELENQRGEESTKLKDENKRLKQDFSRLEQTIKSLEVENDKLSKSKASLELAMGDERTQRSSYESRMAQLKEELTTQTGYAEHYRDTSVRAERELAQLTSTTNDKIEKLEQELKEAVSETTDIKKQLAEQQSLLEKKDKELEEKEKQLLENQDLQGQIKEKNLQIGKLRHEAVILNDHLTNALATVRKGSEGKTIDKELISNLVLQFASIPRGDTKKYEVLQLISNTLDWDETQQAHAGLARQSQPEASSGGLFGKFAEFLERESNKKRTP